MTLAAASRCYFSAKRCPQQRAPPKPALGSALPDPVPSLLLPRFRASRSSKNPPKAKSGIFASAQANARADCEKAASERHLR